MPRLKKLAIALLPLLVVAASLMGAKALVQSKPAPEKKPREESATAVEVQRVQRGRHRVGVRAQGTVVAAQQVRVQPEVTGRVVWQSPQLTPGGRLRKGQPMLRLDARDYELAVEQQQAQVEKARLDLRLERSRKQVAEREWELFGDTPAEPTGEGRLALREPQVQTAEAAVKASKSGLKQARLQLEKTLIRAPFNALVKAESVDPGQVVSPQSQLATLVGSDRFWVQVSLPLDELSWLKVPGIGASSAETGSRARIAQQVGDARIEREGRVVRLLGDLDPVGRMARLLVEIDDPLGLKEDAGSMPLLLGAYVDVTLQGGRLEGVIEVPRVALRDGDRVYVADEDDRLAVRHVDIARRRGQSVLVRGGLADGERVITSALPAAVPGMAVRVMRPGEGT